MYHPTQAWQSSLLCNLISWVSLTCTQCSCHIELYVLPQIHCALSCQFALIVLPGMTLPFSAWKTTRFSSVSPSKEQAMLPWYHMYIDYDAMLVQLLCLCCHPTVTFLSELVLLIMVAPTTYYSPWHIVNIYSIFVEYIYIFMMYQIISLKIAQEVSHFIMLNKQMRTQESGLS